MNNSRFLDVLKESFITYLKTNPRSNKKLEVLHGAISKDLQERLGDKYSVFSLGFEKGKEKKIIGRYVDKTVDITVAENGKPIAGIAVKYVMSNYKQNSNNYFENMLGETANIRSAKIPYFQIFIIPDSVPYFKKGGEISKPEKINEHNLKKYIVLSKDDVNEFLHTPVKTLVFIVHIQDNDESHKFVDKKEYADFYINNDFDMTVSDLKFDFGNSIIYNDYDIFIQKVVYSIKSI